MKQLIKISFALIQLRPKFQFLFCKLFCSFQVQRRCSYRRRGVFIGLLILLFKQRSQHRHERHHNHYTQDSRYPLLHLWYHRPLLWRHEAICRRLCRCLSFHPHHPFLSYHSKHHTNTSHSYSHHPSFKFRYHVDRVGTWIGGDRFGRACGSCFGCVLDLARVETVLLPLSLTSSILVFI